MFEYLIWAGIIPGAEDTPVDMIQGEPVKETEKEHPEVMKCWRFSLLPTATIHSPFSHAFIPSRMVALTSRSILFCFFLTLVHFIHYIQVTCPPNNAFVQLLLVSIICTSYQGGSFLNSSWYSGSREFLVYTFALFSSILS
jgi:hypothetical protein